MTIENPVDAVAIQARIRKRRKDRPFMVRIRRMMEEERAVLEPLAEGDSNVASAPSSPGPGLCEEQDEQA